MSNTHFYHISLNSLIVNIFESKILDEMVTHVYIQLPLFKNPIFCEIMWKSIVDACRP